MSNVTNPIVRQTRPDYTYGYGGGVGVVPRRGWDAMTASLITQAALQPTEGMREFYQTAPLRLLQVLCSIHPMLKMALSNNLCLAFAPGDIRLFAVRDVINKRDDGVIEIVEETDPEATAELVAFWKRYPGGLIAFLRTMARQAKYAGISCAEAVPAKGRLKGLAAAYTFDPITLLFEDQPDGTRVAKQFYQLDHALDPATCFMVPVDGDDDNPYGDPLFSAFLAEGIKDLGQEMNLSDILRGWAYPHVAIGFPFEESVEYAKTNEQVLIGRAVDDETGDPRDMTPYEYAEAEYEKFLDFLRTVNPDDPLVGPKGTEAKVLDGSSGMAALDPVLKMRRHRMVMGADQMPSMLGITEGGTQAYAVQQAKSHAKKLDFERDHCLGIAGSVSDLHLRLQGRKSRAKFELQPIQDVAKLVEAQAREINARTDKAMVDAGWLDNDEAAIKHTGSGAVGPAKPAQGEKDKADDDKNADDDEKDKADDDQDDDGGDDEDER